MADLRIVDAPEIPTENITGEEKLPTGGSGNYSITLDSLADYTKTKKDLADNTSVDNKVNGVRQELDDHIEDLLNPHQVTKGQIGLGNVDNTADADKPVSNSTQAAIISAVAPKADKTYVDNQLTLKANKADVYTKLETYTKQESSYLVNNSISEALTPVNSSLDLAKRGIANRYDSSLTYNSGERVVLANGDIVKSTIDGNTNDPNVDMTGWVKTNAASQIFDASGASQQQINDKLASVTSNTFTPEMFGIVAGEVIDNTSAYSAMIATIPEYSTIIWKDGLYVGNFHSNKSFNVIIEAGATLKPKTGANDPAIKFEPANYQTVTLSTVIDRGTSSITLPSTVNVRKGSLLTLWNGYLRAGDANNPVNFETVLVDQVTLDGSNNKVCRLAIPVRSRQIGGTVNVYVAENPLEKVSFKCDGIILNTDEANFGRLLVLKGCLNPTVPHFVSVGSMGHAVSLEQSYGAVCGLLEFYDPLSTGSGMGYGVIAWKSAEVLIDTVISRGMRHAVDYSDGYGCYTRYVKETDAASSPVSLAHNGFAGDVGVGDVDVFTRNATYIVNTSSQGFADATQRLDHPIHNIKIGKIKIEADVSVELGVRALALDTEMRGVVDIGEVVLNYKTKVQPTTSAQSYLLYVSGQAENLHIGLLKTNCARHVCFARTSSGNRAKSKLKVDEIDLGFSDFGIYTGGYDIEVDNFRYENIARGYLCEVIGSGGTEIFTEAKSVAISNYQPVTSAVAQPLLVASGISLSSGKIASLQTALSASFAVDDATVLATKDIQLKSSFLILGAPAATTKASITIAALPAPTFYNGQELTLSNSRASITNRSVINIPKGTTSEVDLVINSGQTVRLISIAGKWNKI